MNDTLPLDLSFICLEKQIIGNLKCSNACNVGRKRYCLHRKRNDLTPCCSCLSIVKSYQISFFTDLEEKK